MFLYKYFSFNRGKDALSNGLIYLSSPSQFNDIFDCDVKYNNKKKFEELMLLNAFYSNKELIDVYTNKLHGNLKIRRNVKNNVLRSLKEVDENINKYIKFESKSFIGNELLPMINKDYVLYKKYKMIKEIGYKELDLKLNEFRNKLRIACFSEKYDDILMWAHYGDSNKGICIKYEVDDRYFKKVRYVKNRDKLDISEIEKYLLAKEKLNLTFDDISKPLIDLLFLMYTKAEEWSYEQEVRCIAYNDTNSSDFIIREIDNNKLNFYKPIKIVSVYLGANISNESEINIKEIAKEKNIAIYKMYPSKLEYKLVPHKLP